MLFSAYSVLEILFPHLDKAVTKASYFLAGKFSLKYKTCAVELGKSGPNQPNYLTPQSRKKKQPNKKMTAVKDKKFLQFSTTQTGTQLPQNKYLFCTGRKNNSLPANPGKKPAYTDLSLFLPLLGVTTYT